MASLGGEQKIPEVVADSTNPKDIENTNYEKRIDAKTPIKDREDKLKIARERQNEERQKKIEELKLQAEAAQKYREQKEEERKRRIEELRSRDNEKRHQVEERKRAIIEAEKERREYILRKNQERDARLETKKRSDRSLIGFAFGSSTPRLLEPADFGTVSPSIYWGHRRSTSITNVAYTGASIPRRSCERELTDGCKKRATSAGGADRHDEEIVDAPQIAYRSVARRKTDLMPTLPSPRDSYFGSKSSLSNTPRTTGRAVSMDRLDQLSQPLRRNGEHIRAIIEREKRQHFDIKNIMLERCDNHINTNNFGKLKTNLFSISGSMNHIASGVKPINNIHNKVEKSSLAFLGSNLSTSNVHTKSMSQLSGRCYPTTVGISKTSRKYNKDDNTTSGSRSPGGSNYTSRPGSAMSSSTIMSISGSVHRRSAPVARKPRPISIAGTAVSSIDIDEANKQRKVSKMSVPKVPIRPKKPNLSTSMTDSMINSMSRVSISAEKKTPEKKEVPKPSATKSLPRKSKEWTSVEINEDLSSKTKEEKDALNSVKIESTESESAKNTLIQTNKVKKSPVEKTENSIVTESSQEKTDNETEKDVKKTELLVERQDIGDMMTASMIARSKITTEEEAKAALAERRRIAREEAEKQAELERQRLETERLAELKKQSEEEEQQRKFEEEANRLAIEQRQAEQERLNQAIEEAQKREEAEKIKREEEENLRIEREEAEKKAKEEAEKQREEQADRLRREEKEREERRKRVEEIMSRTRKEKTSTPFSTPVKDSENSKLDGKNYEEIPSAETDAENVGVIQQPPNNINITIPTTNVVTNDSSIQNNEKSLNSDHQAIYEKSVADKESDLMNFSIFSNVILDMIDIDASTKNSKNMQQIKSEVAIGKVDKDQEIIKKGTLVNVSSTDQLIDLNNVTENINNPVIFNNNNSLLGTTTTLVTADNHDKQEITL